MSENFELHKFRKNCIEMLEQEIRNCSDKHDLKSLKFEVQRYIRAHADEKEKSPSQVASEFGTCYDNALEYVFGDEHIEIERVSGIISDHDGSIDKSDTDGSTSCIIKSPSGSKYPIYEVSTPKATVENYRICSCPSQKYHLLCKHTIARLIERNYAGSIKM